MTLCGVCHSRIDPNLDAIEKYKLPILLYGRATKTGRKAIKHAHLACYRLAGEYGFRVVEAPR